MAKKTATKKAPAKKAPAKKEKMKGIQIEDLKEMNDIKAGTGVEEGLRKAATVGRR